MRQLIRRHSQVSIDLLALGELCEKAEGFSLAQYILVIHLGIFSYIFGIIAGDYLECQSNELFNRYYSLIVVVQ